MRLAARPAFTLIEIVIAAFVFAVGVLALQATAASSLLRMRRSADLALAATVARSRLEALAASRCASLESGSDTVRTVVSAWVIEATGWPSLRGVTQSVSYTVDGETRTDSYRAMIACSP